MACKGTLSQSHYIYILLIRYSIFLAQSTLLQVDPRPTRVDMNITSNGILDKATFYLTKTLKIEVTQYFQ